MFKKFDTFDVVGAMIGMFILAVIGLFALIGISMYHDLHPETDLTKLHGKIVGQFDEGVVVSVHRIARGTWTDTITELKTTKGTFMIDGTMSADDGAHVTLSKRADESFTLVVEGNQYGWVVRGL